MSYIFLLLSFRQLVGNWLELEITQLIHKDCLICWSLVPSNRDSTTELHSARVEKYKLPGYTWFLSILPSLFVGLLRTKDLTNMIFDYIIHAEKYKLPGYTWFLSILPSLFVGLLRTKDLTNMIFDYIIHAEKYKLPGYTWFLSILPSLFLFMGRLRTKDLTNMIFDYIMADRLIRKQTALSALPGVCKEICWSCVIMYLFNTITSGII